MSGYLLSRISDVGPTDKRLTRPHDQHPRHAAQHPPVTCHVSRDHLITTPSRAWGGIRGEAWTQVSIQSKVPTISRENPRNFVDTFKSLLLITIPTLVTCSGGEMDPAQTGCCSVAGGWQPRQTWYSPFRASQPRGAEQQSEWVRSTHHLTQTLPPAVLTITTRRWRGC